MSFASETKALRGTAYTKQAFTTFRHGINSENKSMMRQQVYLCPTAECDNTAQAMGPSLHRTRQVHGTFLGGVLQHNIHSSL